MAQQVERSPDNLPWYAARPEALRVIAGVVAVVAALVGLVSRLDATHHETYYENSVYGIIDTAHDRVCTNQLRLQPRRGAWQCLNWVEQTHGEVGHEAVDPGGPCTHREANRESGIWECWTQVPLSAAVLHRTPGAVRFGDVHAAGMQSRSGVNGRVCVSEIRASPAGGRWLCRGWTTANAGQFRLRQAFDPGGPCTVRYVDQLTGIWSCRSVGFHDANVGIQGP